MSNQTTEEMIKEFKDSFAYCGVTLTEKTFEQFFTTTPTQKETQNDNIKITG